MAREPVTFDVRVLQHGVTPMAGVTATLAATNRETLTTITVDAEEVPDEAGVYRFEVRFPVGGVWKWHVSIAELPGMTAFPPLTVLGDVATPVVAMPEVMQVSISDTTFTPALVTIAAGSTVEWTNQGVLPHQIVSTNLDFDDSPVLQPGETYRFVFSTPGTYEYFCGPHPQMQGTVKVV
jgi:plastocyanin